MSLFFSLKPWVIVGASRSWLVWWKCQLPRPGAICDPCLNRWPALLRFTAGLHVPKTNDENVFQEAKRKAGVVHSFPYSRCFTLPEEPHVDTKFVVKSNFDQQSNGISLANYMVYIGHLFIIQYTSGIRRWSRKFCASSKRLTRRGVGFVLKPHIIQHGEIPHFWMNFTTICGGLTSLL